MSQSLYEIVTGKIVAALEQGVIPWRKPWDSTVCLPINAITQKAYRGVNALLLGIEAREDHRWLTFKQAQSLGGSIRRGEQSSLVVFWKHSEVAQDEEGNEVRKPPVLRYFNVFNAAQCEGLGLPELPKRHVAPQEERHAKAELLVSSMPDVPTIVQGGISAWYSPLRDLIQIPKIDSFHSSDHYYATLFHELGHATGHVDRLNRKGVSEVAHFGSEVYSQEELVAELTSAFCCATVGLDNSLMDNATAYIDSWLRFLEEEPKALVFAAAQAQKAADYIRGITYA